VLFLHITACLAIRNVYVTRNKLPQSFHLDMLQRQTDRQRDQRTRYPRAIATTKLRVLFSCLSNSSKPASVETRYKLPADIDKYLHRYNGVVRISK